jgi:CheY-like chemotaxis protein
LGLSVLSGIVHAAGGHLLCESTLGQGTCFTVLLPPVATVDNTPPEPIAEIAANQNAASLTLLLVDDDIMVLGLIENQLRKLGHTVHASTLGRAALAEFERQPESFDAVITDYTMPEMDGLMLTNAILAIRPDMPIFLCSGVDLDTLSLPPSIIPIAKPIHFPRFVAALQQACSPATALI